jgi:streptomycin 6-kinase
VSPFPLPTNLVASAARDDTPQRREWLTQLPEAVAELAERWSLRLGQPFQPGGECAWVAPAVDDIGREVVLKVGWRHTEALHEAEGLSLWSDDCAVRVFAAHAYDETSALLLERCRPGVSLDRVVSEPEQDVVVARLLKRMWRRVPPPDHPFRPLAQMCDEWADEFETKLAAAPDAIDSGLARAGMELFRALPRNATAEVVLCTDLHAENILSAQREPWLVIDPKPYVGDPTYDPLQHMYNRDRWLLTDPLGLVSRMAELLELDADRLRLWLFARCVQESIDKPSLREVAARIAPD